MFIHIICSYGEKKIKNIYQIPWVLKIDQMNNSGETTRKKDQKKNKNKYDNKGRGRQGGLILKKIKKKYKK